MIKAKLPDEEGKNGATYRNLIDALDEMIIAVSVSMLSLTSQRAICS